MQHSVASEAWLGLAADQTPCCTFVYNNDEEGHHSIMGSCVWSLLYETGLQTAPAGSCTSRNSYIYAFMWLFCCLKLTLQCPMEDAASALKLSTKHTDH